MIPLIEIVGVYPVVEAQQPVWLVELWIKGYSGKLNFGLFSQELPELAPANEQVAYLEHLLNEEGTEGHEQSLEPIDISADTRAAFFIHYLDTKRTLATPFGSVSLPNPVARPARLSFMEYFEP